MRYPRNSRLYANVIEDMHEGKSTKVTSTCGETENFCVKVGVL